MRVERGERDLMRAQRTSFGWALRLDRGEEIFESLREFAAREGIRSAGFTGIGSIDEAELGFFDPATLTYSRRRFEGDHEIGSLTGNISFLDGAPFPHGHLVLGGRDFVAHTGHLFRAVVSVTCEILVVTDPGTLLRVSRPDLGFSPLEPK